MEWVLANKVQADRLMLFSDLQCYTKHDAYYGGGGSGERSLAKLVNAYRSQVSADFKVYSFDLAGYGTSQFYENDKRNVLIGGWSDRVFNFIPLMEAGELMTKAVDAVKTYNKRAPIEEQ